MHPLSFPIPPPPHPHTPSHNTLPLHTPSAKCQLEAMARYLPSARAFHHHGCWNGNNPVGKPLGRLLRRLSSANSDAFEVGGVMGV